LTGNYYGGLVYDASRCSGLQNLQINGQHYEELGPVNISHQPNNTIDLSLETSAGTCTYHGTYTQAGHVGAIQGTYFCNTGVSGSFAVSDIEKTTSGMTGQFFATSTYCNSLYGRLGGLLR